MLDVEGNEDIPHLQGNRRCLCNLSANAEESGKENGQGQSDKGVSELHDYCRKNFL